MSMLIVTTRLWELFSELSEINQLLQLGDDEFIGQLDALKVSNMLSCSTIS
jgi:hypothetical protein